MVKLRLVSVMAAVFSAGAQQPEWKIDPTLLRRHLEDVAAKAADVTVKDLLEFLVGQSRGWERSLRFAVRTSGFASV
jgi:hypothetical protein